MKRILFFIVFLFFIKGVAFSEFQSDWSLGYFFNTDTYGSLERSFNGLSINMNLRYLFTENIGLFIGGDFKTWFSADNNNYLNRFGITGTNFTFEDGGGSGVKLDLNLGLAFALPLNERFQLQSDLGVSFTLYYIDSISGEVTYMGSQSSFLIQPDNVSSIGFYSSIFGRYLIRSFLNEITGRIRRTYLTFGLRMDYKFTREESGRIVFGTWGSYSIEESNFSGFSIAPFIGGMVSF